MTQTTIHYQRPGKGLTIYYEDFYSEDETCVRTFKTLPPDVELRLTAYLQKDGVLHEGQSVHTIAKVYFFKEPFNILEFRDQHGELIGYYSDIGEPAIRRGENEYEMVDLFLDTWLLPDGRLIEMDWDEFDEAIRDGVITPNQISLARAAMQRIKEEIAQGIYPSRYFAPGKDRIAENQ